MTSTDLLASHERELVELLERDYGLRGNLTALHGEQDANLRVTTDTGPLLIKVAAPGSDVAQIDMQIAALEHVRHAAPDLHIPHAITNRDGAPRSSLTVESHDRVVWLSTWLDGTLLANQQYADTAVCEDLGTVLGKLDRALLTFDDPRADRQLKWDLRQSDWIVDHIDDVSDTQLQDVLVSVHGRFIDVRSQLDDVRRSIIHNDANDHNVLVDPSGNRVTGLIDFGDACRTALVAEVAIAASYAAMHLPDPLQAIDALARGFHRELPLTEQEIALIVPLVETRLAVSLINADIQHRARPDDAYATISQQAARRLLLRLHGRDHHVANERLRKVCGLQTSKRVRAVPEFLRTESATFAPVLGSAVPLTNAAMLDLSFASTTGGDNPLKFDADEAADRIQRAMREAAATVAIGRYAEPRTIYEGPAFGDEHANGNRRTTHLGIDIFAPAGTPVASPLPGQVHDTDVCDDHLDYGGLVIVRHELPDGGAFATLYGHLDPSSIAELYTGKELAAGEPFARLGSKAVNGGWPPHLHLQVLAADPSELPDVPRGVADPDDLEAHLLVHPDPSDLLGLPKNHARFRETQHELGAAREQLFSSNLKTSYRRPLPLVRGYRHFVFDEYGRKHLDAYNNVPHVGHCHPTVTRAVQEQTALLATNTRYLHASMQRYAQRLREWLPDELSVCFFLPSGSEANELALRLARKHTGASDVCVMDHGYHGHTNATMAMSPYKFRQPGAPAKPDWVHVTVQPDTYRGPHSGDGAGLRYASEVHATIDDMRASGRGLAGYICESLPSVGGQLELPAGFLEATYKSVRTAGGLCIADDVQTGLWRTGTHAFGFQKHAVTPDILVLGKPLGNGFPLAALVTTAEVAASFANGPEFFSTFGGSTVAMAAGLAVLDVLRDEGLAENARTVGERLLTGLRELQREHEVIGDVRGRGFFLGVDLVQDRETLQPATEAASRIKNALRERRVLIGTDGPFDNVLKIRPPMTFDAAAADCLLDELQRALKRS